MYALKEPLNEKFLDLARRCQAVLCCRATPLQKVGQLTMFLLVFNVHWLDMRPEDFCQHFPGFFFPGKTVQTFM